MNKISFAHNEKGFFILFEGEIDNVPGKDTITIGPLSFAEMQELRDALNTTMLNATIESVETQESPTLTVAAKPL